MSSQYHLIPARQLCPGDFILVPPANGRHRSRGAVDGSSHIRVLQVVITLDWVEIFFEHGQFTVHNGLMVKVVAK